MHPQIKSYLGQVEKHLSFLPSDRRANELREMEQHIEKLVESFLENGLSEAQAIEAALRQFGPPQRVGRDLNRVSSPSPRLPKAIWAVIFAMTAQLVPLFASLLFAAFEGRDVLGRVSADSVTMWFMLLFFVDRAFSCVAVLALWQARPWGLAVARISLIHQTLLTFGMNCIVISIAPTVYPISTLVAMFSLNLLLGFCLHLLERNRKAYLQFSQVKWGTL